MISTYLNILMFIAITAFFVFVIIAIAWLTVILIKDIEEMIKEISE